MFPCPRLPRASATGVALLWRRLGLIEASGVPTRRGRVAGFFSQGDGLAIAAALEDETYPMEELVYGLANLDASHRFSAETTVGRAAWRKFAKNLRRPNHPRLFGKRRSAQIRRRRRAGRDRRSPRPV